VSTNGCWRATTPVVGAGTTPVAAARVLTLVEIGPLIELPPSVHTVGDGGHAAGPGTLAVELRRTPSAMPRAWVKEVSVAPGLKPSFRRTAPVANPALQQTPWIGSKPMQSNTRLLWTAWWLSATVPQSTVPLVLFTWRGLRGRSARVAEALGMPAAGLHP
jgi:hypothetical protein